MFPDSQFRGLRPGHNRIVQPALFNGPLTTDNRPTMLKSKLLHPEILATIARAGHHGKILIADGNYPASSTLGPNAKLISLQLMPGLPTVNQVLEAILSAVPIDIANTMDYERSGQYA